MGNIYDQINRLISSRNKVRTWLIKTGILSSNSSAKIDDCASKVIDIPIHQIGTKLDVNSTSYAIPSGYHKTGCVNIETQEKTVLLGDSAQTITPDEGKVLSKVYVPALAYAGSAIASHVLSGDTFSSARAGTNVPGTMSNYSNTSVSAADVLYDSEYTYLTIPNDGYYNTNSKIKMPHQKSKAFTGIEQIIESGRGKSGITLEYEFLHDGLYVFSGSISKKPDDVVESQKNTVFSVSLNGVVLTNSASDFWRFGATGDKMFLFNAKKGDKFKYTVSGATIKTEWFGTYYYHGKMGEVIYS